MEKFAYIADGRLYVKCGDGPAGEVVSEFGKQVVERAVRIQQQNEWKNTGPGARFTGGMLWGTSDVDPAAVRIRIVGAARGAAEDEILYSLDTDSCGGFFVTELGKNYERRLFHRENFLARDLSASEDGERVAYSVEFSNQTANLAVSRPDGSKQKIVTEGDSVDGAPAWLPGQNAILFHSAGVGRNQNGYAVGLGPFTIEKLDLETGRLETMLEDPEMDLLFPRPAPDGGVYFIRRPYEAPGQTTIKPGRIILDVLFFPFRVIRAILGFLNFFSMSYTGKPVTSAGAARNEADFKHMILSGRVIAVEKALKKAGEEEHPSLVPASWELVRRNASGEEEVLAKAVISFDVDDGGRVIYTNGSAVFLAEGGKKQVLAKGKLIEHLVWL